MDHLKLGCRYHLRGAQKRLLKALGAVEKPHVRSDFHAHWMRAGELGFSYGKPKNRQGPAVVVTVYLGTDRGRDHTARVLQQLGWVLQDFHESDDIGPEMWWVREIHAAVDYPLPSYDLVPVPPIWSGTGFSARTDGLTSTWYLGNRRKTHTRGYFRAWKGDKVARSPRRYVTRVERVVRGTHLGQIGQLDEIDIKSPVRLSTVQGAYREGAAAYVQAIQVWGWKRALEAACSHQQEHLLRAARKALMSPERLARIVQPQQAMGRGWAAEMRWADKQCRRGRELRLADAPFPQV